MKKISLSFLLVFLSVLQLTAQDAVSEVRNRFFNPSPNYIMVVAHRGDWRFAPENSIRAVTNALKMGVEVVEIDVQKTKDNELIVMHDKTIDRTTTGKGRVAELTLDSIRNVFLRNGAGMSTKHKVPTLREMMVEIKGKPLLVNIDKAWENFDLVMQITEETGTTPQVILKGNEPIGKLRQQYGSLIDKVIYMPMVWPEDYTIYSREKVITPYEYTKAFIEDYRPKAFEVIIKDEVSSVDDALALMKKEGISIWINALWDELCANHSDDRAIDDPDTHWGWIVRKGAHIIQTDYPLQLIEYLESKGLRE